ncbi:MAG: zinc-ribbon domain containing protein [Bacillota bacterium]
MYQDKNLTCKECSETFVFTAGEQEFYAEKGFANEPARCPACRAARKNQMGGGNRNSGRREMHPAVCASCGHTTQVPFKPTGEKPVYCSDCFSMQRAAR